MNVLQSLDYLSLNDNNEGGMLKLLSEAAALPTNNDDSIEEIWTFEQLLRYQADETEREANTITPKGDKSNSAPFTTRASNWEIIPQKVGNIIERKTKKQTKEVRNSAEIKIPLSCISTDKKNQNTLKDQMKFIPNLTNEEKGIVKKLSLLSSEIPDIRPELSREVKRRKVSDPFAINEENTDWVSFPSKDLLVLGRSEGDHEAVAPKMISDKLYHKISNNTTLTDAKKDQRDVDFDRGKYKCKRCGVFKTNHICEYYEDKVMCSVGTQIDNTPIINLLSKQPWEGEKFIVVGTTS